MTDICFFSLLWFVWLLRLCVYLEGNLSWRADQGRDKDVDATRLPVRDGLGVASNHLVHALDSVLVVDFEV